MAKVWERKRGNSNGRRPAHWQKPFYCDGCKRQHGPNVVRNGLPDGRLLCDRQYLRDLRARLPPHLRKYI